MSAIALFFKQGVFKQGVFNQGVFKQERPVDKYVLWSALILAGVGVASVYSAITYFAETQAGGNTNRLLMTHLLRVGAAIGLMGLFSVIDYRILAKYSRYAVFVTVGFLVAVQVVGIAYGGATRWLKIGPFVFQPSDPARVALIIFVAMLLARKQAYIKSFTRCFAPIFFWILLAVALIGTEDLSTAALLMCSALVMCFIARVSLLHISALGIVGLMLGYLLLLGSPARAARIEAWLGIKLFPNTESVEVFSKQGELYQSSQAKIAFATGGLTGVGPGKSARKGFIPASYNDFIYAIIAEEYGVIGAITLLMLYVLILFRGLLRIARRAPDPLGLFLSVGLVVMLSLYGFVHAGVASGLLPVTGLALPFVSYGGSSMIVNGVMIGILLNISRQVD